METVFYTAENISLAPKVKKRIIGNRKHPLYRKWISMKTRCLNRNNFKYKDYGGRGIGICEEWLNYLNYYNDLICLYKEGMEIDRINNAFGYCKENCRFVSTSINASNKRSPRKNGLRGAYKQKNGYMSSIKINQKSYHIGNFNTEKQAHDEYMKVSREWWGERSVV